MISFCRAAWPGLFGLCFDAFASIGASSITSSSVIECPAKRRSRAKQASLLKQTRPPHKPSHKHRQKSIRPATPTNKPFVRPPSSALPHSHHQSWLISSFILQRWAPALLPCICLATPHPPYSHPPHTPHSTVDSIQHTMAEPDDLYTLRQEFYVGNFQVRRKGGREGGRGMGCRFRGRVSCDTCVLAAIPRFVLITKWLKHCSVCPPPCLLFLLLISL